MKRSILIFLLLITATLTAQTNQPVQFKIGYVDSEVILQQYPAAIKAKSDLEGLVAKWRKDQDSMATELQTLYQDYQKKWQNKPVTGEPPKEQVDAQQKIVEKEQRIQQFREQKFGQPNGEYFQKQDQLMAPVKKKIFEAIDEIAKQEGMQFVLDKAGDVVVLYADAQYDITFKVLDRLKRGK